MWLCPRGGAWLHRGSLPRSSWASSARTSTRSTAVPGPPSVPDVAEVVSAVLAARRYRYLDPHFVTRIARDVCRHARRAKDAADETKRRLHQVYGAYVQELPIERFTAELDATVEDSAAQRETALRLMRSHASTRERLEVLDRFYAEVFALTGPPRRVLDLACGFGP